jgi:hypothetical protein
MRFIAYGVGIEQRFSYKEIYDFDIVWMKTIAREDKAEPPIEGWVK